MAKISHKIKKGSNMKNKRIFAVLLSLALAVAMLTVFLAPAGASGLSDIKETLDGNGDGDINYLAIGSAAGAGVSSGEAYPSLVRDKLASVGKTVSLNTLTLPEMRAEELRYLLDASYSGDAYTEEKFLGSNGIFAEAGGASALREEYKKAIAEAEVITLELGGANFLNFALNYAFNSEYEADFTVFDEGLLRSTNEIKGRFEDVLKGYVDSPETAAFLQRVIDGVAYAIVGYAVNFDEVLANIYKINPDVTVTVLNITNPLTGLSAVMSGVDLPLPISMIYGIVADVANIYMASLSAYDGSYNFAYVGEDEFVSFEKDVLSGDLSAELLSYLDGFAKNESARGALVKIIKTAMEYKDLDLTAAATTNKDARALVNSILSAASSSGFSLETNADYIALTSDKGAMTKLAIAIRCGFGSLPALPNTEGHRAMADKIVYAIANSAKGADVIENDMNEVYAFLLDFLDRDILLDLEYTFSPHYVLNPKTSYYVALGDGSAAETLTKSSYVTKLAEQLGLSGRFKNWARAAKGTDNTPEKVLMNIGKYTSDLIKADLITLSFNNATSTAYMFEQLTAAVSGNADVINWAALLDRLDPTIAPQIEDVKEMIKEELVKVLGDESMAGVLLTAAESYAYSYISRLATYPTLVDQIHSINRGKALVVIVGAYNDMANVSVTVGGETISLGTYIQYLIDVANLETLIYSAISDKTAYVACPEIETKLGEVNIDLTNIANIDVNAVTSLIKLESHVPTDASHAKIAKAIIDNITVVAPHTCQYDNDCDTRCEICKNKRAVKDHVFDAVCDEECNICGARNKAPKLHGYDAPCDDKCNTCQKTRDAAEHTYTGDCDTLCDSCGYVRSVSGEHSFGEWKTDGDERIRSCSVCGSTEREAVDNSEGDNTVVIVIIAAFAVTLLGGGGAAVYFLVIKKKPTV